MTATALTPPLKWHGGKQYLAKRIVALMPPHTHYVEAYAGGLSVLLAKSPTGISEVVNDIDGDLTNFWHVLQSPPKFERFHRRLAATPNLVTPRPASTISPTPSRYIVLCGFSLGAGNPWQGDKTLSHRCHAPAPAVA
jgi:D12 class N6 adenine-specific DNA methyltransferase